MEQFRNVPDSRELSKADYLHERERLEGRVTAIDDKLARMKGGHVEAEVTLSDKKHKEFKMLIMLRAGWVQKIHELDKTYEKYAPPEPLRPGFDESRLDQR